MNSTADKPTRDETIIYHTKCHWAVLLGPLLVVFIGGLALGSQRYHAMALIAFGLIWGSSAYASLRRSEIGLTRNRVLVNGSFPLKKAYDIPLNEIISIDYYQPSLGSMLGFGKIIIVHNGRKKCAFRFVSCPAEFVGEVRQQISRLSTSSTAEL